MNISNGLGYRIKLVTLAYYMDREWEIKQAIGCMWAKASMKPSVQCRLYQVDDHKSKAMVVNTSENLQDSVIFVGVNSLPDRKSVV